MLGIPVNEKFKSVKCGTEPCRDIITTFVKKAKEETDEKRDRLQEENPLSINQNTEPIEQKAKAFTNKSKNRIIRSRNYLTSST